MKEELDCYSDDFVICPAAIEDAGVVYNIMMEVYNGLADKSVLVCGDADYVRRNISDTGFTLIAYHKESVEDVAGNTVNMVPAGIFIFEYPKSGRENLGRDIGLPEEELPKVVHMDTVAVRSAFRGHHLQKRMLEAGEKMIDSKQYRYLMATAAPYNKPSLNTFLGCGYRIMKVCDKYGGVQRAVLLKELY